MILGDLTDAKDYHPAELVNRVVRAIDGLRKHVPRIVILKGNHDLQKAGHTFFQFLDALEGVEVISQPVEDRDTVGRPAYFLPHTRTPARDWAGLDLSHYKLVFLHQTLKGAIAGNGQAMDGDQLPGGFLNAAGMVYSGDIHVPQRVGCVEYVGSPYPVHFGDAFVPRCVVLDRSGEPHDLHYPSIRRVILDVAGDESLQDLVQLKFGDQVKIRVHLHESEKHQWRQERAYWTEQCQMLGLSLMGLEMRVRKTRERVRLGDRPAADFDPIRAAERYVEEGQLGGELLDAALEVMEGR